MFPCSAGPCCIYKVCFPVKCDGNLNCFLQNKPLAEEWRHTPSALKGRKKKKQKNNKQTEKQKARTETKEIKPSLLQGSISNLFFCLAQLNLWEGKAGRSRTSLAPSPWLSKGSTAKTWGCLSLAGSASALLCLEPRGRH